MLFRSEAAVRLELHVTIGGAGMVMDAIDIFEFDDAGRITVGKAYWDMTRARTA